MSIPLDPEIPIGTAVEVYWNLHKHLFSVRDLSTRRVIAHVTNLQLLDVTFRVSESGRQKVLREKRKNVHAFLRGVVSPDELHLRGPREGYAEVSYNPYKAGFFYEVETGRALRGASYVHLLAESDGKTNHASILAHRVKSLDSLSLA